MTELFRTRDCVVFCKGDAFPVAVSAALRTGGWAGGQGVKWVDSSPDEFTVGYSDGLYGGFLLYGSDESSDQFTAMTRQQPTYGYAVLCAGGWLISTLSYEKYTYASRQVGPLVPITYTAGIRLRFSIRGLFTIEDEWTLSGDPRAPNNYYVGSIVSAPSSATNNQLTLQTSI